MKNQPNNQSSKGDTVKNQPNKQPPFGYEKNANGQIAQSESEQTILSLIDDLKDSGLTYARIASELESQGHITKRGGRWRANSQRQAPFGYSLSSSGELTEVESEQVILSLIEELRASGLTYARIASELKLQDRPWWERVKV